MALLVMVLVGCAAQRPNLSLHLFRGAVPPGADRPLVTLRNDGDHALRGAGPHGNFFGNLLRREGDRWVLVGGRVGCGTVFPGMPLAPGRALETQAPDYLGHRDPIDAPAEYRFVIVVVTDTGSEHAFSIDLTGEEILRAQPEFAEPAPARSP